VVNLRMRARKVQADIGNKLNWYCILVAKYGAFLFTEIGAVVITDYKLTQN